MLMNSEKHRRRDLRDRSRAARLRRSSLSCPQSLHLSDDGAAGQSWARSCNASVMTGHDGLAVDQAGYGAVELACRHWSLRVVQLPKRSTSLAVVRKPSQTIRLQTSLSQL